MKVTFACSQDRSSTANDDSHRCTRDICCAALEAEQDELGVLFAVPGDTKATVHKIKAGEVGRLMSILNDGRAKAERELGRPLQIVLCYGVGLRWLLARLASDRTGYSHSCLRSGEFFDAASRPPRQNGSAFDVEGMTRTLRTWLSGDRRDGARGLCSGLSNKRMQSESNGNENTWLRSAPASLGASRDFWRSTGIWLTGKRISKGVRGCLRSDAKTG